MAVTPQGGDFPKRRLWTREEYYRADDLGIFRPDERLELIGGTVFKKPDQTPPHSAAISLAAQAIRSRLQPNMQVRIRQPLSIGENSDPEPDISVVAGAARDYAEAHPATALLVIEVSDTTLAFDRREKSSLYASASVLEYLIVNLRDRLLERRQNPKPSPDAIFGAEYAALNTLGPDDRYECSSIPGLAFTVSEILP